MSQNLWHNRSVGLLGGSFNPAHEGHRHISLYALKMLGLDAVWWMVSPQNPLKARDGMGALEDRIASAQKVARHPKIYVTDIEAELGTQFTADTLHALKIQFPTTKFVWLMGTDNLRQIDKWDHWQDIFKAVPVCVIDRPPQFSGVKGCKAATRYRPYLMDMGKAALLKNSVPPAWCVLHVPLNHMSATQIRQNKP